MADENRGVVYEGPGKVAVKDIEYPSFVLREGPGVPPGSAGRRAVTVARAMSDVRLAIAAPAAIAAAAASCGCSARSARRW